MKKVADHLFDIKMSEFWPIIHQIMEGRGYMSGVDRQSERVKATGEVFTPNGLVMELLQKLPLQELRMGKTVLDPACGDGQFLLPAVLVKIALQQLSDPTIINSDQGRIEAKLNALREIYGVDIMDDNIKLSRDRLLESLGLQNHAEAKSIVKNNILIGNTLSPCEDIIGQTANDKKRMIELFSNDGQQSTDQTHQQRNILQKNTFLHRVNQPTQAVYIEFLRYIKTTGQKVPKFPKRIGSHTEIIEYTGTPFWASQDF